ncbi:hypothetical protein TrLO_g3872 [Triparma laevis f. longispina]|uniref:WW domain-containing protein n=1 Tax=Triparma laevis f. longispina TaxID=1714387 RepID=A0A9W7AP63_9STRA|nr:hypothetical protein TrLO_g3872 [Triparma laevis f. longispina]
MFGLGKSAKVGITHSPLSAAPPKCFTSGAAAIGRRDFTDDDFDDWDGDDEVVTSPAGRGGYDSKTAILKPKVPTNSIRATSAIPTGGGGGGGRILQLAPGGKQNMQNLNPTAPQHNSFQGQTISNIVAGKQVKASSAIQSEMSAAYQAEEQARNAKYRRRQSQILASDEMKKAEKLLRQANEAKDQQDKALRNADEATKSKLDAMALSEKEKDEMNRALKDAAEAQEKRMKIENDLTDDRELAKKLKIEGEAAAREKDEAEQNRRKEIDAARKAELEAKEAMNERLKASEMTAHAKEDVAKALKDMEEMRKARLEAEEKAAKESELASKAAALNQAQAKERKLAEERLREEMDLAKKFEMEAVEEAKRKSEALARKEINQAEADEATRLAEEAAKNKQGILEKLERESAEVAKALKVYQEAEKVKVEAQEKLKIESEKLAEAEKQAQENTEKRLNAVVKSEEEKKALLEVVAEANALTQKKIWAERKLRQEAEKAAEISVKLKYEEERRAEAEKKRGIEMAAAEKAEEEAKLNVQKRLDLVKATEEEREEIKKALKQAEVHRSVKKKAEQKMKKAELEMKSVLEGKEKAENDLEQQKAELEKIREETKRAKEEAKAALDEARIAGEVAKQAADLTREAFGNGETLDKAKSTRMETAKYVQELQAQLAGQMKLQEQARKADEELIDMDKEMEDVAKRQQAAKGGGRRGSTVLMEMVEQEKAAMEEQAKILEQLEKDAQELQKKRLELQKKRDEENALLKEMMDKNQGTAQQPVMLKSSGSLYDVLQKGGQEKSLDASTDKAQRRGSIIMEENEEEEEEDNDWRLKVCDTCRRKRGDLPVVHFAAASGHIQCLTYIANNDSSQISTFDKAQRSPLFYACANNQTLTAVYLIELAPQTVMLCDSNGDTPLHAASQAGSAELIELLISRGGASVNSLNNLGISCAHLATNRECLHILFDAGADIKLKDKQKRSPLFVSCAMNRKECAEFICEILEIEGESFQETDRRGDTPLHAAACNGSAECCRMLLDLAVEPGVRNKKGLRPIDLAIKRRHQDCEQLLAEFHLHHATTDSHFDSVFFLATLQGHRSIKTELEENDEVYEIVQTESANRARQQGTAPQRVDSMWSLRTKRSVRLQQWGSWICYEDQNVGNVFWYDQKTKQNSYQKPPEVEALQKKAMDDATSRWETLTKTASMRIKKIGEWIQYTGGMGRTFYFNEKTYEFQWEKPEEVSAAGEGDGGGGGGGECGLVDNPSKTSSSPVKQLSPQKTNPKQDKAKKALLRAQREKARLLQEWTTYRDPGSGMTFWHNNLSGESLWEPPPGFAELEKKLKIMADEMEEDDDDEGAVVVGGLDDLGI